jgi:TonB family protein
MRKFGLLIAVLIFAAPAVSPALPAGYQTDRGTRGFLFYHLLSGGEISFPPEALRQNLQGSGFFLMRLRPDGVVESVTTKMSTGYRVLDEHIIRVLKAYRFKPGTKQPIEWLVGFIQPATVIVKLNLIKEESPPSPPKKK